MLELEYIDYCKLFLQDHFYINEEVDGSGRWGRKRIDMIITPKNKTLWKNKNISFGVEFKTPSNCSRKDFSKLFRQAYEYSETDFHGFGEVPILISPGIQSYFTNTHEMFVVRGIMARFGIMELDLHHWAGMSILYNGTHRVWSYVKGCEDGKRLNFKQYEKRANSRVDLQRAREAD